MDYKKLILGVLIVIVLYIIYRYVFKDNTSADLAYDTNAKNQSVIKASQIPGNPAAVDFTFSIWIYVDSWQYKYGKDKTIFRRSNKQGDLSPSVNLAAATNDLNITLVTFPQTSGSTGNTETWKIHNIPLQKWTNIIVATNNRAVDTYIDGKLVNTHVLKGVPKMDKEAPIYLTPDGGFSGNTAKFRYFSRTLSPREAYQIYKDGPGGNMLTDLLNKYKLKVQFLKDNEEINGFEI